MNIIKEKKKIVVLLSLLSIVLSLGVLAYFNAFKVHSTHESSNKNINNEAQSVIQSEDKVDLSKIKKDESMPDCCNVK